MSKNDVLRLLRAARNVYVSGAELARTLGVSRTAVWKQVRALAGDGYCIEAVPSKGYRLTASPDLLRIDELLSGGAPGAIGRDVRYSAELASTNTAALEAAQQGAPEGTVVIAEHQTAGRGRRGRAWVSPRGNLFLSVILRPELPTHKAPLLTLMGAVAVASALRKDCGLDAGIKWPNDILISGKKISGLLTEMSAEPDRIRHIILGIGVNVNMTPDDLPSDVRGIATSVAGETGAPADRTAIARGILQELDRWYHRLLTDEAAVLDAWRSLNVTLGRQVSVSGPEGTISGRAEEIDNEGRLVVGLPDGTLRTVAAGDVTLLTTT